MPGFISILYVYFGVKAYGRTIEGGRLIRHMRRKKAVECPSKAPALINQCSIEYYLFFYAVNTFFPLHCRLILASLGFNISSTFNCNTLR